jgi:ribonuclease T2
MRIRTLVALMGIGAAMLAPAQAEERKAWPWPSDVFNAQKRTDVAGNFDYYLLVLSWSPTHCMTASPGKDDMQCARRDGQRFGFILHGLWPQYEKGYPERCRAPWRPFVPEPVIASLRDVMPSRGLVIHEYRTHGTCSGLKPAPYFALARKLYDRIKIPKRYQNPFDMQFVGPREVLGDFLSANPGLKPDMIAVMCGGSGNRLSEVRICMTKDGRPRSCSSSALPHAPCRADKMHVPPVRSTWRQGHDRVLGEPGGAAPLPRPPIIESPRTF